MRCLQKFAINNRLLGQMMQATEAELKTVTAATAAAGQRATDLATTGQTTEDADSEGGEAAAGDQQSLLEALLSRLEDAELISRKRLEESAATKANPVVWPRRSWRSRRRTGCTRIVYLATFAAAAISTFGSLTSDGARRYAER